MTDIAKIVALAYDSGTLKRVTKTYAYISNVRYKYNSNGDIIQVSRRTFKGGTHWMDVK